MGHQCFVSFEDFLGRLSDICTGIARCQPDEVLHSTSSGLFFQIRRIETIEASQNAFRSCQTRGNRFVIGKLGKIR